MAVSPLDPPVDILMCVPQVEQVAVAVATRSLTAGTSIDQCGRGRRHRGGNPAIVVIRPGGEVEFGPLCARGRVPGGDRAIVALSGVRIARPMIRLVEGFARGTIEVAHPLAAGYAG